MVCRDCQGGMQLLLETYQMLLILTLHRYVDSLPVTASELESATQKDPVLSKVLYYTQTGWPQEISDSL